MRSGATAIISCLLAAACSQLLGIDGRYSRDESTPLPSGPAEVLDSGAGGNPERPPRNTSEAGGTTTDTQMPLVLPPAVPGMPPPQVVRDAGRSQCAEGFKLCGEVCVEMTPEHGCGGPRCDSCVHANAHTSCGKDGACESICDPGFTPVGMDCVPQKGTSGAPGAGGAPPVQDAGPSGGGSGEPLPCDPLECPTCNRGFEGCCIPPGPEGTPTSRCGCFYFPPFCTTKVPG